MIKTIEEIVALDNGFVKIYNNLVEFPNKTQGYYYKISNSDRFPNYGVCGLVITEDNKIILMDNYRYAHEDFSSETIKGFGMSNKTPLETFIIEMKEEVGFISDDITFVKKIRSDNTDSLVYLFIAKTATPLNNTAHEDTEIIENIQSYTLQEIKEKIKNNAITDPLTLVILQHYLLFGV